MKVSIIIPVYNAEKYIQRCAKSLFEQDYKDIEYIFVDDNSYDSGISILKKITHEYPKRVTQVTIIEHSRNMGVAVARNTGLKNATGEIIMWTDADDYVEKDFVSSTIEVFLKEDADIVCIPYYRHIGKKKQIKDAKQYEDKTDAINDILRKKTNTAMWSRAIKRSLFEINKLRFYDGINMGEDWAMLSRIYYFANKIGNCKNPTYHYMLKQSENSYTSTLSVEHAMQNFDSLTRIEEYYSDKEKVFQDAIQLQKIAALANGIRACAINNNFGNFFYECKRLAKQTDKKNWRTIKIRYRIFLLIDSIPLLKITSYFFKL